MAQAKPEPIIALAERIKLQSHRARRRGDLSLAANLRLCALYLRRHAAVLIADEAGGERDHHRRRELVNESAKLRREARTS
jgi:hypothetical protein